MTAPSLPAILTARRDAGAGMNLVTLTPSSHEQAAGYVAPGQYVEVRGESKGFFVLAGELGAPSWELLVRMNGGASDALTNLPEGSMFEVAGPLGTGFPLARARGRKLAVAVAGSALAVTRPILRDRVAHREGPLTRVYIGARSANDVPLVDEVAGWAHAGARVVLCLSRPDLDDASALPEARRAEGYVQKVLASELSEGLLVFAAGPAAMLDDVRALPIESVTNV